MSGESATTRNQGCLLNRSRKATLDTNITPQLNQHAGQKSTTWNMGAKSHVRWLRAPIIRRIRRIRRKMHDNPLVLTERASMRSRDASEAVIGQRVRSHATWSARAISGGVTRTHLGLSRHSFSRPSSALSLATSAAVDQSLSSPRLRVQRLSRHGSFAHVLAPSYRSPVQSHALVFPDMSVLLAIRPFTFSKLSIRIV